MLRYMGNYFMAILPRFSFQNFFKLKTMQKSFNVRAGIATPTHPKLPVIQEASKKKPSNHEFSYNNAGINMITGFGKF